MVSYATKMITNLKGNQIKLFLSRRQVMFVIEDNGESKWERNGICKIQGYFQPETLVQQFFFSFMTIQFVNIFLKLVFQEVILDEETNYNK